MSGEDLIAEKKKRLTSEEKKELDRRFPGWDYPLYPGVKSLTLAEIMKMHVATIPDKPCVVFGDKTYTWKDEDERSNAIANALLDLDIKRQDNVSIMMRNRSEYMDINMACWKLATIGPNVNYRYVPSELHYLINQQESPILFLTDDLIEVVNKVRPDLKHVKNYVVVGKNVPEDMISYEDLLKKYPKTDPKLPWKAPDPTDFIANFYTGGTTGLPKGCLWRGDTLIGMAIGLVTGAAGGVISKLAKSPKGAISGLVGGLGKSIGGSIGSILSSVGGILEHPAIRTILGLPFIPTLLESNFLAERILPPLIEPGARLLLPLLGSIMGGSKALIAAPLIHGAGFAGGLIFSALGCAQLYLTAPSFSAKETCELLERHKPIGMWAVGDAYYRPILAELDRKHYDINPLLMLSVGVTWSPDVKRRLLEHIPNAFILDAFSATEAISPAVGLTLSADEEIPYHIFESVKVDPKRGIRVINPETLKDVKPGSGEVGVWAVGGKVGVPVGYYGEPEKAKEVYRIIDGKQWNVFGDMCTVDKDGYVHFLSKDKEVINTGGEKVYAEEVEDVINGNPKVRRSKVVSVPDERFTNAVTAVVELKEGEKATPEEIREFCRDKLSGYKLPRHVYFMDRLPEQVSGKVEIFRVEKWAREMWEKEGKPPAIV